MNINLFKLRKILLEQSEFCIYGCGQIATDIYSCLQRMNLKPQYCIITEKKNEDDFQGIPIYSIWEKLEEIKKRNIFILLAVNKQNAEEIEKLLWSLKISNYLNWDYFLRDYNRYYRMSMEEYIEEIAWWHIESIGDFNSNIVREIGLIEKKLKEKKQDPQKIIFLVSAFTPRVIKIAKALLGYGYKIEMYVTPRGGIQDIFKEELNTLEMECTKCATIEELMYRLIMSEGKVIHDFTNRGNLHNDKILINMKSLFPPIVFDEYDIVGVFYTNVSQKVIDDEKYCLENVDAICNRGFEIDYLKEVHKYSIGANYIQFHDYCCDGRCETNISSDEQLSICYIGGVCSEEEYPDFTKSFRELARKCEENKCYFHVYPNIWNEKRLKEYIKLSNYNKYFLIHKPKPYELLSKEISQHDYGIFPICDEFLKTDKWGYNTHEKLIYCTSNKYFDYLDAGLPVISPISEKLVQFFKEKGIWLNWTVENYDFDELRNRKKELKERVREEQQKLQISNHIEEIIKLYNCIT